MSTPTPTRCQSLHCANHTLNGRCDRCQEIWDAGKCGNFYCSEGQRVPSRQDGLCSTCHHKHQRKECRFLKCTHESTPGKKDGFCSRCRSAICRVLYTDLDGHHGWRGLMREALGKTDLRPDQIKFKEKWGILRFDTEIKENHPILDKLENKSGLMCHKCGTTENVENKAGESGHFLTRCPQH